MPRLSACIEMLFRDRPFLERVAAVRSCGLDAIEFWGWRGKDLPALAAACEEQGVVVSAFGMDTGGPLTAPGDIDALLHGVRASLDAAATVGARTLIVTTGNEQPGVDRAAQRELIVAKLQAAAPMLEDAGVCAVLEPLNVLVDHPGYFLVHSAEALGLVREVGSPNVQLLFDVYHQQISEGNVTRNLLAALPELGHIHIADNPGRHEPGTGELCYSHLFRCLDESGYGGWVGLEFTPSDDAASAIRSTLALCGA
jgi:hydroxypyruvate isomerase